MIFLTEKMLSLVLVILGFYCVAAQDEGSGALCFEPKTVRYDCNDEDKLVLFHFSPLDNRCKGFLTCPLSYHESENSVFSTKKACEQACPATECPHPSLIANGFYYMSRSEDGVVTAHYTCLNSYALVGPSERRCQHNGVWSGDEPSCELSGVSCNDSPNVDGATRHLFCKTPGCLVVYSCKNEEGYERVYGKGYRKCGQDGKWLNDLPICARLRVMQDESEVSDEIKVEDGQTNFEVRCIIEPQVPPSAVVHWTRVGGNGVVENTHWLSDNRSLALNFDQVNYDDAGKYKCYMELDKHIERSIDFVVISPEIQKTVHKIFSYSSVSSAAIMLTCVFKGSEKPVVNWFINDTQIIPGGRYIVSDKTRFHSEINFSVLQIASPDRSVDFGTYSCRANGDNSTREFFQVQAAGAESRAKRSLNENQTKNMITSSSPSFPHLKSSLLSSSSVCADETTDVFVGRFKKQLKEKHILRVTRRLNSSFYQSKLNNKQSSSVIVAGAPGIQTIHSPTDLYIFVVSTEKHGQQSIMEYYPYSESLETIINNVCS